MKRYGFRIGQIGIEFSDKESRMRAITNFTNSSTVTINNAAGIRYKDAESAFAIYERDSVEVLVNCCKCQGVFSQEICGNRTYPNKHSWEKEFTEVKDYICNGCLASQRDAQKVFEAKKTLDQEES